MRWIRFTILLVAITLLNVSSLMDLIAFGSLNIRPDLLLILLVFATMNCNIHDTVLISFAIGFAADISGVAMGPSTLVFGVVGCIVSLTRQVVTMKRMVHQGLAVFVVGFIAGLLVQFFTLLKTGQAATSMFRVVSGTAMYSAIAAPFLWYILLILSGWLGTRHGPKRGN